MPLAPYVQPARDAVEYPEVRVSRLTLDQPGVGRPVVVGYRVDRYRLAAGGAEDAPASAAVSAVAELSVGDLLADPALAAAVQTITEYAVARAVADGLLTPEG